jgi:glucose/arabinose dehydrogenase
MFKKIMVLVLMGPMLFVKGSHAGAPEQARLKFKHNLAHLSAALGIKVEIYADNVPKARQLALGDKGTVFVGSKEDDKVRALVDEDGDMLADKMYVVASGLNQPNGVAFKNGALYIGEIHRISRIDNIEDYLANPPKPVTVNDQLPTDAWHGWKYIRFGPDGKLYVPVGAPCNVCDKSKEDERFGTILRMNADGSGVEIFARGVRNSVGFDWDPKTNELWFTDNGRDMMGDDLPPDELNKASKPGMHFGFPHCHGRDVPDPEFAGERKCEEFTPAAFALDPHVAALGMRFYRGNMFPEGYKLHALIAEHGSWNSSVKVGYRISAVRVIDGVANHYGTILKGFEVGDTVYGRPVDIMEMPDGSLLVSDDHAGMIYRLSF